MVNSFIRYSPYSKSDYEKSVSKPSQACQGHHKHYDKKVSYYYMIFIFF